MGNLYVPLRLLVFYPLLKPLFSSKYREIVSKCSPPYVPYIAVLLKDITFIDDGNKTKLESAPHMVNWSKCVLLSKSIEVVTGNADCFYVFHKIPEIASYIAKFGVLSEKAQWSLSQTVEPREAPQV